MAKERITYPPETKKEAVRLILEENYTQQQAAEYVGCNINSIKNWLDAAKSHNKRAKSTTSAGPVKRRRRKRVKRATVTTVASQHSFDEFVQGYWSTHKEAAEVLQLPPDLAPEAVRYVNNVLRYAYNTLGRE